jgi:LPS-assembly protein
MIGEFQWHPLDRFSARLGVQWDWEEAELDVASVGFVHRSADGNRLAFEYRFRRDRVDQFDVRYYWPISETWSVVSRLMYSLEESDVLEMDAGFEYESCCWAVRAVARRYLRDRDGGYRDALYLELRLKGLGSFGRQGPSLFYDP